MYVPEKSRRPITNYSAPCRVCNNDEMTTHDFEQRLDSDASTRTLASSPQSYRYENGRRYHAYRDGSYWGPNDEKDVYHQTVTHHLFYRTLDDRMLLAPVTDPRNVLDIGTGVGLWAVNFADAHPEARVTGTDLSPLWENPVQPNLRFQVDDCCSEWTYLEELRERFDVIHMRCLYGSVADWNQLYRRCFEHLIPGGYIEQAEMSIIPHSCNGPLPHASIFRQWECFWRKCGVLTGKSWLISETMKESIEEAGFVDVCERRFKWPIGMWSSDPKLQEIGRWYREFWESGMEGWVMALGTRCLGWTASQARAFVEETRKALSDETNRVYFELVVVYGRRPDHFRPHTSCYEHRRTQSQP
ncbi:hypothetical protein DTO280E4_7212 [Paecilomyces variotii]|nr:hypothetical protein DTO280E4_7212 [Paecilomyces variotii]KAJ9393050.1 hypothetical protein DTO063F5_187 [Paecilomyces variotii]